MSVLTGTEPAVREIVDFAIIALDRDGTIASWNAGAERLQGYTAEEALGQHFSVFYTPEDREAGLPERLLTQALVDGRVEDIGWRTRKDGARYWADVVITSTHDDAGRHVGFVKVTRDLTEKHELEEALRRSEQRYRVLVSQVVDYAIFALDPTGLIESWNLGAEAVKGYTESEAVGQHFSMFYSPEDRAAGLPERLLGIAAREGRVEHTGWRVRKDGSRFWADVIITALRDDDGVLTGYAKVTRDLSELKQLQQAQDQFYAAFEHDLRTPLTAIKGFTAMIRQRRDEDPEPFLARVETNADRLMRMSVELGAYSKLRSGRLALNIDRVDLKSVAQQTASSVVSIAHGSPIEVTGDHVEVFGDRLALERIVTNLLVNATKYSEPGSPVVIDCQRNAHRGLIRVTDLGRGIAPADKDVVFKAYERGQLAQADGGQGLGLASVRRLVELQDGDVVLMSEVGVGTTVEVRLPLASSAAAEPPAATTSPVPAVPTPPAG